MSQIQKCWNKSKYNAWKGTYDPATRRIEENKADVLENMQTIFRTIEAFKNFWDGAQLPEGEYSLEMHNWSPVQGTIKKRDYKESIEVVFKYEQRGDMAKPYWKTGTKMKPFLRNKSSICICSNAKITNAW